MKRIPPSGKASRRPGCKPSDATEGAYGDFTALVIDMIRAIPRSKVASYGQIAALAGNPRASRQVSRILHSLTAKQRLPWHRVVNGRGRISLPEGCGYEEQKALLIKEGVRFKLGDDIDLDTHLWRPRARTIRA